ncbi:MAG TPA: hypothetical protein VL134_09295, partial [Leptolyngbya sp.]|nr:hypothetical protein [Leptolyngbya sp.]
MLSSQAARIAIIIAGSPFLGMNSAIAGTFYSITPLPFQPADLNNFGDVVGQHYLWHSGTLFDIRTFPGATDSTLNARGINDNGWIVGDGLRLDPSAPFYQFGNNRGFIFDRTQVTPILPTPAIFSMPTTAAIDINNRNQVVVNEQLFGGTGTLGNTVRIEPDRTSIPLFRGAQFGSVNATAINAQGQAVGFTLSSGRTGPSPAYRSDGTNTIPLISPGYCSIFFDFIVSQCEPGISPPQPSANGLNDRGQVVGAGALIRANEAPIRALIWEDPAVNPIAKDLGSLGQVVSEG